MSEISLVLRILIAAHVEQTPAGKNWLHKMFWLLAGVMASSAFRHQTYSQDPSTGPYATAAFGFEILVDMCHSFLSVVGLLWVLVLLPKAQTVFSDAGGRPAMAYIQREASVASFLFANTYAFVDLLASLASPSVGSFQAEVRFICTVDSAADHVARQLGSGAVPALQVSRPSCHSIMRDGL